MRLRYFLSINVPLNKKVIEDKTYYLSAYNEIFINTEGELFDRDRLFGGLGYKLSDDIRFELGYMVQYFQEGSRDQLNIISFVNFWIRGRTFSSTFFLLIIMG